MKIGSIGLTLIVVSLLLSLICGSAYQLGYYRYAKQDYSQQTIYFFRIASSRYQSLYFDEKMQNKELKRINRILNETNKQILIKYYGSIGNKRFSEIPIK